MQSSEDQRPLLDFEDEGSEKSVPSFGKTMHGIWIWLGIAISFVVHGGLVLHTTKVDLGQHTGVSEFGMCLHVAQSLSTYLLLIA